MEQNPYESPTAVESGSGPTIVLPIVFALAGAVLGLFSFSQCLSTAGFFIDLLANTGIIFRMGGSIIGLLVGIPAGAIAGWKLGKGRRVSWRAVLIGSVTLCIAFSSTLLLAVGSIQVMLILPILGLLSGAVVGAIVSLLFPKPLQN